MKPAATPRMTVLHQSPVGLRSIVTSLAAFLIIVSSISLLFERGQEAQVQVAVEHRNQEKVAIAEHHDQQEAEVLQFKVAAADEHHDQQMRGN
jgi:anti-sigma-K factor RskA